MKTAVLSLLIAVSVAVLSLFQFEKYQKLSQATQLTFSKLENEISSRVTQLDNNINLLKGQDQAILNHMKLSTWIIAEIEYLVNLANTQLETTRDLRSAILLLTKAKDKVQRLNDANLEPLQNALYMDLESLQNTTTPDLKILWLKIGTLIQETSRLNPQQAFVRPVHNNQLAEIKKTESKSWKELFQDSFQELKDLVKIQHHAKPVEPMLSEAQRVLVRENLRLLLEQARLAVLTNDNEIYQKSIQDTNDWLLTYYVESQPEVKSIQRALYTMSKIDLLTELPAITSVNYLQNLKALR